jgi:phospholipase/carboxylesterase
MQFALERLRYTVPKHYFDEALSGSTPKDDDIIELL